MEKVECQAIELSQVERVDHDELDDQPEPSSVLKIMVDKHDAIEKVVALIKNEIRPGQGSPSPESKSSKSANNHNSNKQHSSGQVDRAAQLYDGLNQLLDDTRFQHMIREVGVETASVIDRAREQINSSRTIEEKRTAFSIGLMELQMNLATRKKQLVKDPNYNFAMSLVGLRGQGSL